LIRSVRGPLLIGLLCGTFAFLVGEIGWLAGLDARAYDVAVRARRSRDAGSRVVVVEIDDESIAALGRWPWPRSRHAQFLATLRKHYRPAAVVFDLLFPDHGRPDHDAGFAAEIGESGNVYLAGFFTPLAQPTRREAAARIPWLRGEYTGEPQWRGKHFSGLMSPIPALSTHAAGIGHVNVFPELDGCVRRLPLVIEHDGVPYISLLGVVLNAFVNPEQEPVTVALGEVIAFGSYRVPIDETGESWISYKPPTDNRRGFDRYGYDSVLSRDVPAAAFQDKIVLVGFGATGMADIHPTPLSAGALGVEINAHALNGLLQGSFLGPAGGAARLAFAILFGLLACLAAAVWSPGKALPVAVALPAAGLAAAAVVLSWRGLWLGSAAPGLAAIAGYTATVALRFRESERDALQVRAGVEALALATRVIGSARRREDLFREIRSQIHDAMEALQSNLYLLNEETGRLTLSLPLHSERMPVAYEIGEGTVGWVARHGMTHLVNQVGEGTDLAEELARSVGFAVGSVVYAPMSHRGQIMGVIEAVRGVGESPFEPRHLPMLEALATEAAVALENVALYEKLQGRVEIANRKLLAAYQELKQERDRISAIVSNMADGVILTDAQRRVVFMNPAAANMFGVELQQVEGRPAAEVLPHPPLLEQLEDDPPTTTRIPRIQLREPRRMTLSPRTVRLSQPEGTRTGAITVVSDVTLLEELSEMKTEFVSVVSHELRTPLTSIMGFAQTLEDTSGAVDEEERGEFLTIIQQESSRLLVMINDLLDMSRMEAGRPLPMSYTDVDVEQLSRHVVRFQSVTTTAHTFRFEFPDGGVRVVADSDKVQQIVTNLVSNAIKYSPKGGDIVVGAYGQNEECVGYVRDQGIGMGPEEQARLFQPYQRIDRDAIKGIRGTGLGLYLVRALVEAHAGRVWVESERGKGSTFYFSLPLRPTQEEKAV